MGLLDKLEQVEIKADSRLPEDDLMVLAKEKLNLFMKGDETDMDDIYEQFGVDYDLKSLLLYRDVDDEGHFSIRWGEQEIA